MPHSSYKGCVYRASLNVGKKRRCYIGKALTGLSARKSQHYAQAKRGISTHFAKALLAYDKSAWIWEELFRSDDDALLKQVEIQQISGHRNDGWKLFNHSDGGDGITGWKWTPQHRAKMREIINERKALGLCARRPDTRSKISIAVKGRSRKPHTAESIEKMRAGMAASWARRKAEP